MSASISIACVFLAISWALMLVAFASPYWVESFEEYKGQFVKMGLWEVCFNDYTFYGDRSGKRYLGCFYVFSNTIRPIWEWVSPPWFICVEVLVSCALLFIFITALVCVLYIFKLFSKRSEPSVLLGMAALQMFTVLIILIALILFGVKKEDRRWMPRPDMNFLSWSYGLAVLSALCSTTAAIFLAWAGHSKAKAMKYYQPPATTFA